LLANLVVCQLAHRFDQDGMGLMTSSTAWPDATITGVPVGTTLAPSGPLRITTPATVIGNVNIAGMVDIQASNVTPENCKITSAAFAAVVAEAGVTGVVIQNSEIDREVLSNPNSGTYRVYIKGGGGTVSNCNICGVGFGVTIGGGPALMENNYIHDLNAGPGTYYNGMQYNGGGTAGLIDIEHNTIINQNNRTDAVMIDNDFGPVNGVTINNNLLVGGDYTVYDDDHFNSNPSTNVSITNNHLGTGLFEYTDSNGTSPVFMGNVDDGTALVQTLNQSGFGASMRHD
jgi:hypothetical protein